MQMNMPTIRQTPPCLIHVITERHGCINVGVLITSRGAPKHVHAAPSRNSFSCGLAAPAQARGA